MASRIDILINTPDKLRNQVENDAAIDDTLISALPRALPLSLKRSNHDAYHAVLDSTAAQSPTNSPKEMVTAEKATDRNGIDSPIVMDADMDTRVQSYYDSPETDVPAEAVYMEDKVTRDVKFKRRVLVVGNNDETFITVSTDPCNVLKLLEAPIIQNAAQLRNGPTLHHDACNYIDSKKAKISEGTNYSTTTEPSSVPATQPPPAAKNGSSSLPNAKSLRRNLIYDRLCRGLSANPLRDEPERRTVAHQKRRRRDEA